jgi:glycerophosphoryl diester phosphodiesterase
MIVILMAASFIIIFEVARIGDFYIPPRDYNILNVTSSEAPFLAFGRLTSHTESETAKIPVYVNENEDRRLGYLKITPSKLDFTLGDTFEFPIGETTALTLRIIRTSRMRGHIRTSTPIPLPDRAIIGHRGFGANSFTSNHLENSLPSFKAALSAGANAVELDVQIAKGGAAVVNHNLDVEAKSEDCRYNVRVNQLTVKEFKKSGLCTPFEISRPTFRDVLESLPGSAILDVHLKLSADQNSSPYLDRNDFIDSVIAEIEKYSPDRQLFFCTFDLLLAVTVALRQPKYKMLLLAGIPEEDPVSLFVNHIRRVIPLLKWAGVSGFVFYSPNLIAANGFVEELINLDFVVLSWGPENLNEQGVAKQIKMGVSGLVTDDIEATRELVRKVAWS